MIFTGVSRPVFRKFRANMDEHGTGSKAPEIKYFLVGSGSDRQRLPIS